MGQRRPKVFRCSPILAYVVAVLSLSLFSWGLGYKLSLYHSHQSAPRMAAAKLLPRRNGQPVHNLLDSLVRVWPPVH